MKYQPPHEVRDQSKLCSMIESLKNGNSLPPVLVCGEIAYSGTHRLAAWEALGMVPDVIELDNEDIAAAMAYIGLEPGYDEIQRYDDIEEALMALEII